MSDAETRRRRAADTGMWLLVASQVMLFASLFSGYVLLRVGSETWPTPWLQPEASWASGGAAALQTAWLVSAVAAIARPLRGAQAAADRVGGLVRGWPVVASLAFGIGWLRAAEQMVSAGRGPATSVAAASWFVLTGAVAAGVLAGGVAVAWQTWRPGTVPRDYVFANLRRHWVLMLACWLVTVAGMYLV